MTKLYRVLGKRGRITIPFEIRQRVGFTYNDVLSFTESPDAERSPSSVRKFAITAPAPRPLTKMPR